MHGRLKVKSTEQQNEEKKKEREEKKVKYQMSMKHIFHLRENFRSNNKNDEESYESESLSKITTDLLTHSALLLLSNPDINTLWNIRKEVILFKKTCNPEPKS